MFEMSLEDICRRARGRLAGDQDKFEHGDSGGLKELEWRIEGLASQKGKRNECGATEETNVFDVNVWELGKHRLWFCGKHDMRWWWQVTIMMDFFHSTNDAANALILNTKTDM